MPRPSGISECRRPAPTGGSDASRPITHRRVLSIALPVVLANATIPILGAVDTGVVGQLGEAAPIGGVGIGVVILSALYWMFGFLRMSTTGWPLRRAERRTQARSLRCWSAPC